MHESAARLLLVQVDSWMTGVNENVAGRQKRTFMAYAGGAPKYRQKCDKIAARRRRDDGNGWRPAAFVLMSSTVAPTLLYPKVAHARLYFPAIE